MKKTGLWQNAFFLFLCLTILHQSFSFSTIRVSSSSSAASSLELYTKSLYSSIGLESAGLSWKAFSSAMKGIDYLKNKQSIKNGDVLTVVDFSKPSTEKRMFVIDLANEKVLFNTYVAHGMNSGKEFANQFSNRPESFQSSLGFYETLSTYNGKHGYSLKLAGLERGINDKAEERAIVMHAAPYVSEGFISSKGFLGRSWGCPAVPQALNKPIIDKIKNGSCLFIYSDNQKYLQQSRIINS